MRIQHISKVFILTLSLSFSLTTPAIMRAQNNALWVWNTRQIMDQPEWRDSLLVVTSQFRINTLFLYFPYDISDNGDSLEFFKKDSLKSLLLWAKEHSLIVHALAGEPEWALPWNHNRPLTFTREVLKLQKEIGMPEGIQFDIEPYLLLPFSLPQTKQQLISDWINVVWKVGKLIRQEGSLVYGIALPFWMEDTITVEGMTLPIGNHLSFLTDYLAIMAYRYKAEGSASVISFSEQERLWAEHARRKIYVGIETIRLGGSTTHYVCEVNPDTFSVRINRKFGEYSNYHFRHKKISVEIVNGKVLIGVSGTEFSVQELTELKRGLMESFDGKVITISVENLADHVRRSERIESVDNIILNDGTFALRVITEELKQSTMFDLSRDDFNREYSILLRHSERYEAVEGIAIHHFTSVRKYLKY